MGFYIILSPSNASILVILKILFKFTSNKSMVFPDTNDEEDPARASGYTLQRDRPNGKPLYTSDFSPAVEGPIFNR